MTIDREKLKRIFVDHGEDVEITDRYKGGALCTAIIFNGRKINNVVPVLYAELFNNVDGENIEEKIYEASIKAIERESPESINYDARKLYDYNYVKPRLRACLRPRTEDDDTLTKPWMALELYIRIVLDDLIHDDRMVSTIVKREMLDVYDVTAAQIFCDALENSEREVAAASMSDIILGGMESIRDIDEFTFDKNARPFPLFVISNKEITYGAVAMCFHSVLSKAATELENDIIIIPASVNEAFILPYSDKVNESIADMIRSANTETCSIDEVLSDGRFYIYKRESGEVVYG